MRGAVRLSVLVAGLLALVAPASAAEPDASQRIFFPDCDEVIALIPVQRENVDGSVPAPFAERVLDPLPFNLEDEAELAVRSTDCGVEIPAGTARGRALWGEVRVSLDPPPGERGFDGYELAWVTDNADFSEWAKSGTGLGGVVFHSNGLERHLGPFTGIDDNFRFKMPAPRQWAYAVAARARPPAEAPPVSLEGSLWRETGVSTVRFKFRTEAPPTGMGGDQLGSAEGVITTDPDSQLAALLKGSAGCTSDRVRTSCRFRAGAGMGLGLSVIVNDEDFERSVE